MFQLSLVDHIRLSFGTVVRAYEGHTEAAARLARWAWYAKLATLALLGLGVAASILSAVRGGAFTLAAPVLVGLAFGAFAANLAIGPDGRVHAHRAMAARLWLISEKYRTLLAEIHDQLIDLPVVTNRRDALLREVAELFGQGPPADRATYDIARRTLAGAQGGYSDQQLDEFLPTSLRRSA